MKYIGKLYGKLASKTFDTGYTTEDWDKKQSEIDELVAYIKNANIRFFTDESINEYNELIQKHTKK